LGSCRNLRADSKGQASDYRGQAHFLHLKVPLVPAAGSPIAAAKQSESCSCRPAGSLSGTQHGRRHWWFKQRNRPGKRSRRSASHGVAQTASFFAGRKTGCSGAEVARGVALTQDCVRSGKIPSSSVPFSEEMGGGAAIYTWACRVRRRTERPRLGGIWK